MKWVVNELTVAEYFKLTVAYKYVKNRRLKERLSLEITGVSYGIISSTF